jgi:hypothetical protein
MPWCILLARHNKNPRHKKLEHGDNDYECTACKLFFRYLSSIDEGRVVFLHLRRDLAQDEIKRLLRSRSTSPSSLLNRANTTWNSAVLL